MSAPTPEGVLWSLVHGAIGTRVAAVVAELGVADALAGGSRPVDELAAEVGADADTLHRYSGHSRARASSRKSSRACSRTPLPRRCSDATSPGARSHSSSEASGTGRSATSTRTAGRRSEGTSWAWLADHPRERSLFDRAMEEGKERRVERLAGFEWNGETVVDVGGGDDGLIQVSCP
jgi:C-methyltransferase